MIHYLVTAAHAYTMEVYLQTWGRRLRTRVDIVPYERLATYRWLPQGTWVFSDLERLSDPQMDLARRAWRALADAGGSRLLNDPHRVLRREELLLALHAAGLNPFTVHRASGDRSAVRFPAFVRRASEHDGAQTPLLHSRADLDRALADLTAAGTVPLGDLLVVEFCDTADADGTYRKLSATRVGPRVLPNHLFRGRQWMLKFTGHTDAPTAAEEAAYLSANPHAAELDRIFALAHIDYGRIDYGVTAEGRVVTWEINTNPVVTDEPAKVPVPCLVGHAGVADAYHVALSELDAPAVGAPVPLRLPRPLRAALGHPLRRRALRRAGRVLHRLLRATPCRQLLAAAE